MTMQDEAIAARRAALRVIDGDGIKADKNRTLQFTTKLNVIIDDDFDSEKLDYETNDDEIKLGFSVAQFKYILDYCERRDIGLGEYIRRACCTQEQMIEIEKMIGRENPNR